MKCLLFIILAVCAVKCDDNNYYVIEMPDDRLEDQERPFNVYWNVPTMQCKSKKLPFTNLYEKYGILQNKNDSFRGEEISILYDPGLFPALLKNETSGKFKFRNGGVPQEGDLELHLETFKSVLDQSIPDPDFHGVGIIDFESWRPVFRQNFGILVPYKDVSIEIEKKMHWWWPKQWIQAEAKQRFEEAARTFMQTTLSVAKQLRPKAVWGYYGFPYCFNMANKNMKESCADKVPEENDRTYWLWSESTALYPSIYSSKDLTSSQLAGLIRGRMKEAERVRRKNTSILPYFWFRYRDGGYLSEEDLNTALETLYKSKASGFIIWGSSNDVNTVTKCKKLRQYLEDTLGPAISAFTKPTTKLKDDVPSMPNESMTTKRPNPQTNNKDPEFDWEPPENYAQDIKNYVEEEIKKKGLNFNKLNDSIKVNDSVLMDIILKSLMEERDMTKNEMKGLPFVDITTDPYRQSHSDTSQTVDLSTATVQIKDKKDTNIFYSTESIPTELIDNSQTATKDFSPENIVTKLLQNSQNTPDVSSTIVSTTEYFPSLKTSQMFSTEYLVTKLLQNQQATTESPPLETADVSDLKDVAQNRFTSGVVTLQDDMKNEEIELVLKPLPTEFLQLNDKLSSIESSTIESQDKHTSSLSTENLSTELTSSTKGSSNVGTEDLVTKLLQKETSSIDYSTTETTYSSENFDKTFSGEYFATKLLHNIEKVTQDSTDSTTDDLDNHKTTQTIIKDYTEKHTSEATTLANFITKSYSSGESSRKDKDYPYYDDQITDVSGITTENYVGSSSTSDFSTFISNKYTPESTGTKSENEKETESTFTVQFFNQDTFFGKTENSANNLTKADVFDTTEDLINRKEETSSTVQSTTELDQVNFYVL